MKTILIPCLVLSGILLSSIASAQSDPNPAKTRALELRDALTALGKSGDASQESWDTIRTQIDNYQKEFGATTATSNNIILLRKHELSIAKHFSEPTRYLALLQQLAKDPLPAVAEIASQQIAARQRQEDLKTKPVDLRFTAVDGETVDLAALRGKVVLIDFWAAWCPDCIAEASRVVEIYKKRHNEGFEVVGVSLDENKEAMLEFAKRHGMTWPQFYDGKKWNNEIAKSFGISSIPAMWLVNRKGFLATKDGAADLEGQVERLLKAP